MLINTLKALIQKLFLKFSLFNLLTIILKVPVNMILLLKISLTKCVRFCIILNRGHRYLTFWFVFYIYFFSKSCGLSSTTNLVNTHKCSVYVTCGTQKNSKAPMSYICHVLPSQHTEPTKFLIIPLTIILSRSIYALFFS